MLPNTAKRFYRFVTVLVIISWIWIGINLLISIPLNVCLFKNVLGIPCPACGTTHSVQAILSGRFEEAFMVNSLGYCALAVLAILPVWLMCDSILQRNSLFECYNNIDANFRKNPIWLILILVLVSINWIWLLFTVQ